MVLQNRHALFACNRKRRHAPPSAGWQSRGSEALSGVSTQSCRPKKHKPYPLTPTEDTLELHLELPSSGDLSYSAPVAASPTFATSECCAKA